MQYNNIGSFGLSLRDNNIEMPILDTNYLRNLFNQFLEKLKEIPIAIKESIYQNNDNFKDSQINESPFQKIKTPKENSYEDNYIGINDPYNCSIIDTAIFYDVRGKSMREYVKHVIFAPVIDFLDEFLIQVKEDPFLNQEFYDFFKFTLIFEYLVETPGKLIEKEDVDFVLDFLELFHNIFYFNEQSVPDGVNNLEEWDGDSYRKYLKEYDIFKKKFLDLVEKFYTKMYDQDQDQDETIIAISNLFVE